MRMRYQALAHFTAKLPDLYTQKPDTNPEFPGRDTAAAIHSGVVGGILAGDDRHTATLSTTLWPFQYANLWGRCELL
ncbi:MAG: type III pantothenate kinase [Saprospiraceae bacterium]|nr:type III pantothenate kinase [Saprospiraceae bacterium]